MVELLVFLHADLKHGDITTNSAQEIPCFTKQGQALPNLTPFLFLTRVGSHKNCVSLTYNRNLLKFYLSKIHGLTMRSVK